ncbi:MAG: glycine cleavage system aminomethyltransferase GcvT [Oscillospiraceae bacterium]|nr:glycine cleavage system aminomethyltransferase GcvT [Oscillospiraceae bacterium]
MERKTPLYAEHEKLGGKIVPFAGWLLPVQYGAGVIAEHMAVREKAGLFDVSHMGEVLYEGPDALANLNALLTNDFTDMPDGKVRYSVMCNDAGGCVDDLIVYKYGPEKYMVVVNAGNRDKDVAWMRAHLSGDVRFTDISDETAEVALQGPLSRQILLRVCAEGDIPEKYYTFRHGVRVAGAEAVVSRTGYTGELGYEIYVANADAPAVWNALLAAGAADGLLPCGLGARDTLRLEAAMPLYGHEMDETITPLETGLDFGVKMEKADFVGRAALLAKGMPAVCRVGLRVTGRGIVREHCDIWDGAAPVGRSTSGTHAPFLGYPVAMALVDKAHAAAGTKLEADVRGRRVEVEVVPLPFYKRAK